MIDNKEMDPKVIEKENISKIESEYKKFILNDQHPCIMAKSLFKMEKYHLYVYKDIHDAESHKQLMQDIERYITQYDFDGHDYQSFIASFPNNSFADELSFETCLWDFLQNLHDIDNLDWDSSVSDDPNHALFSFSLKGKAFYVVGLHPKSSRMARQAPYTTVVFNLHYQFEKLREMGTFHAVRDTIRKNDEALQGSINPVLRDFGNDSETKQYSGRNVEPTWKCPFHKN